MKKFNHSAVRKIIQEINRINLESADYDYIKKKVGNLFGGLKFKGISYDKGQALFRGIIYQVKPTNVSFLGAPPRDKTTGFQRCNSPGNPLFYCSLHKSPVLYEIHPKKGDKVYMSKWSVKKDGQFILSLSPNHLDDDMSSIDSAVHSFFDTKFSEPIHETYSYRYKVTSAIAELLMYDGLFVDGKVMGITHTSVAYLGNSENVVLLPEYADHILSLDYVEELEVVDVTDNGFKTRSTDIATEFTDNAIFWKGRSRQHSIAPMSIAHFTKENGGWVMKDNEGNIIDPD